MLIYAHEPSRAINYGSMSHEAEVQLVHPLLELDFFSEVGVQRRLAIYPFENYHNKSELICEIMDRIWPSKQGNLLFPIYKSFEHYLTASGKRGHFLHQFEVFLLGQNLLLQLWKKTEKPNDVFKVSSITELIQVWLLTSTTHDLGYPLQVASEIMRQLSTLYRDLELTTLAEKYNSIKFENTILNEAELKGFAVKSGALSYYISIDEIMNEVLTTSTDLTKPEVDKLIAKFVSSERHGYVSAKILCRTIIKELFADKYPALTKVNEKLFHLLKLAMAATALHDIPSELHKYISKLAFEKNPYAYLLFIIDNIQDWSRSIVPNPKFPEYNLLKVSITNDHLLIDYLLVLDNWTEDAIKHSEDEIIARHDLLSKLKPLKIQMNYGIEVNFYRNDSTKFNNSVKLIL